MAELHLPEDDALRYVLGELTATEQTQFERRLTQSAELRALVRELQEGTVALSIAASRRRPPRDLWRQIQDRIASQAKWTWKLRALWTGSRRQGWTAAAACLAGWIGYALWVNWPGPSDAPTTRVADVPPSHGPTGAGISEEKTALVSQHYTATNTSLQLLQARTQEIGTLRWQMSELTNQLTQLSQALAQQEALLAEPGRFKFFQLIQPAGGRNSATTTPVSPELQRALLVAMGRELGWQTSGSPPEGSEEQEWWGNASPPGRTNYAGVDFVDLRAGSNTVATAGSPSQANLEPSMPTEPASVSEPESATHPVTSTEPSVVASASSNAVPGFTTGTNAVLAFDSSIVPTGSLLTFWRTSGNGQFQTLGGAVLGTSPLAVLVPYNFSASAGGNLTVTAAMPNGASNVVGHLWTQGTASP